MASNFNLPIDWSRLENDRIRLVAFEENIEGWTETYIQDTLRNPSVWDWLTIGPFADTAEYLAWYDKIARPYSGVLFFAIILKGGTLTRKDPTTGQTTTAEVADGTFAGISSLLARTPEHAMAEIGQNLLTDFHRTFVGTHANALLLHYCLDSIEQGGLGLRRVQWTANSNNTASINAAKRLGFQFEGITRWQQVLPLGKRGSEGADLDRKGMPKVARDGTEWGAGRHTATLAICWDDWIEGGRDHVDALVRR